MASGFWLGIGIISVSGLFNGIFALPTKYFRQWRWENIWLLFSLFSSLIFPVLLAIGFAPNLWAVYTSTPIRILIVPLCFGLLLGIAQVTYGLGIASVGMAIAIAVVTGVSCVAGALVPLIFLHPADLLRPRGISLLVSIPIIMIGLALYGRAGRRRENEQSAATSDAKAFPWSFGTGLAICIITGILGSSINLGFAFSDGIIRNSVERGGNPVTSTYAVWALVFGASFIPNLIYWSYLLFRNHGWSLFLGTGSGKEMMFTVGMAVLSFAAFVGYGIGATVLGTYGTSAGWIAFSAITVVASTLAGLVAGEWKNTAQRTRRLLFSAVAVMLASVVVLDLGGLF